uniref:Uncharacterized protein n=1 Tax=Timema poppense TaxID=170557 RepID=A0A7R9CUW3_TIMPO|nr:unnamed protein product [Timema poppensis]
MLTKTKEPRLPFRRRHYRVRLLWCCLRDYGRDIDIDVIRPMYRSQKHRDFAMISSTMKILSCSILLVNLDSILKSFKSDGASMRDPSLYTDSGLSDGFAEPDFNPVPDTAGLGIPRQAASITLTCLITFSAIGLFAYLCLLIGSSRGNRYLLLPAMILDMLIIVLSTFTFIALMILTFSYDTGLGVAYMLGGFVGNGLQLYLWLCVLSLFQHLREIQNVIHSAFSEPLQLLMCTSFKLQPEQT